MRIGRSSSRPQPLADDRPRQVPPDVVAVLGLDLVADDPVPSIRFDDASDARDPAERDPGIRPHGVHLHVHRFRAPQPRSQVVRRVDRDDAALVDDDDALAGLRDFRQDVRAQDDRVIAGELFDELAAFR